jgi:tetratricopeptide (TPR) repeat protein
MIENDTAMKREAGNAIVSLSPQLLTKTNFDAETLSGMAAGYAAVGKKDLALQTIRKAKDLAPVSDDPYRAALISLNAGNVEFVLGDDDAAIAEFDKALSMPGDVSAGLLSWDPALAKLRKNPRFVQMLARHR